jgi:hypothetical protein
VRSPILLPPIARSPSAAELAASPVGAGERPPSRHDLAAIAATLLVVALAAEVALLAPCRWEEKP